VSERFHFCLLRQGSLWQILIFQKSQFLAVFAQFVPQDFILLFEFGHVQALAVKRRLHLLQLIYSRFKLLFKPGNYFVLVAEL